MITIMSVLAMLHDFEASTFGASCGDLLFAHDAPVQHLFLVKSGLVHLIRHQDNGAPTVMQRAGPSTIVAEASMFAANYRCDAVVMADAGIRRIRIADVRERLGRDPVFAAACAEHFAREVQRMRVRSEILGMKTVATRLEAWLAVNGGALPAKGQWRAVADDIGVSPEAFYRQLAKCRSHRPASR